MNTPIIATADGQVVVHTGPQQVKAGQHFNYEGLPQELKDKIVVSASVQDQARTFKIRRVSA
jgi:hypothetical protein